MYSTEFNEYYAYLSLENILGKKHKNFTKSEKPDFHNYIDDIGLEVTRAMTPQDGWMNDLCNKYAGCHKDDIPKKTINDMPGEFFYDENDKRIGASYTKGFYNLSNHIDEIIDSYETKIKKLNKNYKLFKINTLYIFSCANDYQIEPCIEKIKELNSNYKNMFEILIINNSDNFYYYDFSKDTMQLYELDVDYLSNIKKRALELANNNKA